MFLSISARISFLALLLAGPLSSLTPEVAHAAQEFFDKATGFVVRVPPGFDIRNPRKDASHEVLVDIVSLSGQPPVAAASHALCAAGFRSFPAGFDKSLADLRDPQALSAMAAETRAVLEAGGMEMQSIQPLESADFAGIEYEMIPPNGPDHRNFRLYMAIMDRPAGRTDLVCATTKEAIIPATGLFRQMLGGMEIQAP